jgi:hypothetical protein
LLSVFRKSSLKPSPQNAWQRTTIVYLNTNSGSAEDLPRLRGKLKN